MICMSYRKNPRSIIKFNILLFFLGVTSEWITSLFRTWKLVHNFLTCNELHMANKYWKTKVFSSTENIPNIQVIPNKGKITAMFQIVALQKYDIYMADLVTISTNSMQTNDFIIEFSFSNHLPNSTFVCLSRTLWFANCTKYLYEDTKIYLSNKFKSLNEYWLNETGRSQNRKDWW